MHLRPKYNSGYNKTEGNIGGTLSDKKHSHIFSGTPSRVIRIKNKDKSMGPH